MTTPGRVQRRRDGKNWPGAVYVGRPTMWGNPFRADASASDPDRVAASAAGAHTAAHAYQLWLMGHSALAHIEPERRARILAGLPTLSGATLSCWCRHNEPCHADILIALANKPDESEVTA